MDRQEIINEFHKLFYESWNKYDRSWLGVHIVKYPTDMFIYQMIIYENKPDFIIETGTFRGGGSLFLATMCEIVGCGQVISIDRRDLMRAKHPRLTQVLGRSTSVETLDRIRDMVGEGSCMAVLDSDHTLNHVKRELVHYGEIVTPGQYMVCEDTYLGHPIEKDRYKDNGPWEAVQWFLKRTKTFEVVPKEDQFLISMSPGGWLRKK